MGAVSLPSPRSPGPCSGIRRIASVFTSVNPWFPSPNRSFKIHHSNSSVPVRQSQLPAVSGKVPSPIPDAHPGHEASRISCCFKATTDGKFDLRSSRNLGSHRGSVMPASHPASVLSLPHPGRKRRAALRLRALNLPASHPAVSRPRWPLCSGQYSRLVFRPGSGTGYLPSLSACTGAGLSIVSLSAFGAYSCSWLSMSSSVTSCPVCAA